MTNLEVINSLGTLNQLRTYKLPVAIMWAISKNHNSLNKIYELYEAERLRIIKSYAQTDENGNVVENEYGVQFNNDVNRAICMSELTHLTEQDNPDLVISKVKLDDLLQGDSERYDALDISQVSGLAFMINE